MAISRVHEKQTGATATATLAITSATAGNLLVVFLSTTGTATPKGKDNVSGETGWTANATKALFAASADSLWVLTKVAVGGETELNPSAGTIQGLSYFELSGASETVDAITHKDNMTTATTATSEPITTTDAGDIILAAVGFASGSGVINAWTGTGPMANVETVSTRCLGGSLIPGTTETAATFTANWTTSHVMGMLVVAIKPAGGTPSGSGEISGGGKVTASGSKIATGTPQVTGAGRVPIPTTSNRIAKGTGAVTGGGLVSATGAKPAAHEAKVTGAGNVTASGSRRASAVAKVTGAGSTSASASTRRSASVSVSGAGNLATTASRIASGSGKVSGAGRTTLTSSRRASGVAQVTGAGRTLATYSTKRSGAVSLTGAGRVLAEGGNTVKPIVVRVTGGGLVVATGAAGPSYQFPLGRPRPGHASVGQVGRLGAVRGRIGSGNQGRAS